MIVFSIDPGNIQSGWCIVDGETMKPQDFGKTDNDELLDSFERLIREYIKWTLLLLKWWRVTVCRLDVKCLKRACGLADLQKNQSNYKRMFNT